MSRNLKVFLAAILFVGIFTQNEVCRHLGFGQERLHKASSGNLVEDKKEVVVDESVQEQNYFINDTIYRWDERRLDWVMSDKAINFAKLTSYATSSSEIAKPIEIEWKTLMDIQYRLRYFAEIDSEMYAPVFGEAVEALNGKEVVIEGFVIPFAEDDNLLPLSYSSYASCFFCGKASPASVISMYLKDKGKRYKMDDFKKFRGTLQLNYSDPNEFYYILRDAVEE